MQPDLDLTTDERPQCRGLLGEGVGDLAEWVQDGADAPPRPWLKTFLGELVTALGDLSESIKPDKQRSARQPAAGDSVRP